MRPPRVRLTVRRVMVVVAVIATCMAAFRIHLSLGSFTTGVLCLTLARTFSALDRSRGRGMSPTFRQEASILLGSLAISTTILAVSCVAFLTIYYAFELERVARSSHPSPEYSPAGVAFGVIISMLVASRLRQVLWPFDSEEPTSRQPRRWAGLWPLVVVTLIALAIGVEELRQRWVFCRMMAAFHARSEAQAADVEDAALHAWLKREYERRMWRPWLRIHPDPAK